MRVTSCLAILVLGACLDTKRGSRQAEDPEPEPEPTTCEATPLTITQTGRVDEARSWPIELGDFAIGGDAVVMVNDGTTGSNAPDDSEVTRFVPATGEREQITFNDAPDILIAANGERLLVRRGEWEHNVLVLIDGDDERVLATEGEGPLMANANALGTSVVTWTECLDTPCKNMRVQVFDGAATTTLTTTSTARSAFVLAGPSADGGDVVWAERADPPLPPAEATRWSVKRWNAGVTTTIASDLEVWGAPRPSAGVVYLQTNDGIVRLDSAGLQTVVARGESTYPSIVATDSGRAILEHEGDYFLYADTLMPFGTTTGFVSAADLHGDIVTWAEYEDPTAGCSNIDARGHVMLATLDALDAPTSVAEVGIGCLCCDAYWSMPIVALGDGLVAWNYAETERNPGAGYTVAVGFARFDFEACD